MKKHLASVSIVCILWLLAGCSSSSIVSNKNADLQGPYHRMFIVLKTDIHTVPFTDPWMKNIHEAFNKRGIEMKSFELMNRSKNDLSLERDPDNDSLNATINQFHPECVMIIQLTRIEAYGGVQIGAPGSNGANFDIKLFNVADSKNPVWRAQFKVFANYGISLAAENGTKKFLTKLEEDQVIAQVAQANTATN